MELIVCVKQVPDAAVPPAGGPTPEVAGDGAKAHGAGGKKLPPSAEAGGR